MAIAHQQTQGAESTTTSVTVSSFAVGSGTDRTLVAIIASWWNPATGTPSVSSVVFNTTENFTYRAKAELNFATTRWGECEIWTLDNPSNATADVVATLSEAPNAGSRLIVLEYTGANNGVGANVGSATGNSADPQVTFTTTTSDGLIVAGLEFNSGSATPFTPDGSETERADGAYTSISYWAGELAASAGSQTVDLTANTSGRWSFAAIELLAASGGGPTYTLTADAGSLEITGVDATLTAARKLIAEAGAIELTGVDAALVVSRVLVAAAGSLTFTGVDATLTYTPVGGPTYTLAADAGSYVLTGTDAALVVARVLAANAGTLALTGTDAALTVARTILAEAGALELSGADATLTVSRILAAAPGVIELTGTDAALTVGRVLAAQAGSLTLTGTDAALIASRVLVAGAGSIELTGVAVTFLYSGAEPVVTPDSRIYVINAEDRIYVIVLEDRALAISAEDRTLAINQ